MHTQGGITYMNTSIFIFRENPERILMFLAKSNKLAREYQRLKQQLRFSAKDIIQQSFFSISCIF